MTSRRTVGVGISGRAAFAACAITWASLAQAQTRPPTAAMPSLPAAESTAQPAESPVPPAAPGRAPVAPVPAPVTDASEPGAPTAPPAVAAPPSGPPPQGPTPPPGAYAPLWGAETQVGQRYPPEPPPFRIERHWYGWQTLVTDGASIALLASTTDVGGGIGALGYYFGAPIVHFSHGSVGKGLGSFAIRAGSTVIFVAGAVSCFSFEENRGDESGCYLGVLGFLGMIAAIPIDAAALGWEDVPEKRTAFGPFERLRLSPFVGPRAHGRASAPAVGDPAFTAPAVAGNDFRAGLNLGGAF